MSMLSCKSLTLPHERMHSVGESNAEDRRNVPTINTKPLKVLKEEDAIKELSSNAVRSPVTGAQPRFVTSLHQSLVLESKSSAPQIRRG